MIVFKWKFIIYLLKLSVFLIIVIKNMTKKKKENTNKLKEKSEKSGGI